MKSTTLDSHMATRPNRLSQALYIRKIARKQSIPMRQARWRYVLMLLILMLITSTAAALVISGIIKITIKILEYAN
jgi:hypothetical protein